MPSRLARRLGPSGQLGLVIVGAIVIFALVGPTISGWDPNASDFSLTRDALGAPPGPSRAHWLGVDHLFRDLFSRLAAGARLSLAVAVLATALTTALGALVGVAAGMTADGPLGIIDTALMRLVDVVLALPYLIFVTAIGVAVGRADDGAILLILGLTGWTGAARIVRGKTMQIRALDFVAAARALGAKPMRIVTRHVIPNLTGTIVAVAGTTVGQMILAEAVLGYLTVGVQAPEASLGRMLHEGEPYLGTRFGLIALPGFLILLAVLGFHRLGEGLEEALGRGEAKRARGGLPFDLLLAGAAMLLFTMAAPNSVRPPIGADRAAAPPRRGGVLRVATMVNLRSVDPALGFDEVWRSMSELCFARLVGWDAEGKIVPDLAEDFTASPDGLAYSFTLREGLRFHDGTELHAADVKRSLERLLHPKTPTPAAAFYGMIKGFSAYHAGKADHLEGVRVTGERTLTIDLDRPDATFLPKMTLTFAAPVCASAGAFADPTSPALPCGAGPFKVAAYEPDSRVRFARFEGYHLPGRPYLDGVDWQLSVPAVSQRYKFEQGDLDYVRDLGARDSVLYEGSPAWARNTRWTAKQGTHAIFLNTEVAPFDNRHVRRAVAKAIDPGALERMRSGIVVADRVVPRSIPGLPDRPPMRRHDLAGALEEMALAGFPFDPATGRGGYPREIEYIAVPDSGDQVSAEIWQQQLAKIGIRIRLRLVTFATFLTEPARRRTVAMGKAGWDADFPDPSNFFEPILASSAIQDEGSDNVSFFSNAELDAILDRAHGDPDRARRLAAYERAEEIIRDEAPWIPTYAVRVFEAWQPALQGYTAHAMVMGRFNDVWLDRAQDRAAAAARRPSVGPALIGSPP